ncbi:MAG: hypothetical protein SFX19_06470 [Alphaproteobacteria bacterium]|nr:hypothetical protein [Alphaproteobacteria bacterium]
MVEPEAPATTRRGFLGKVGAWMSAAGLGGLARSLGFADESEAVNNSAEASGAPADNAAPKVIDRLPGSVEQLMQLSPEEKVMLAAATASGCDAVAYYTADGHGAFSASEIIQLYPPAHYRESGTRQPEFAANLAEYNPATHTTAEQVMDNAQYHIPVPVYSADGRATDQIKGVIVLHAPQEGLSKLQSTAQDHKNDLHEPVESRMAKLKMAEDIVSEHQDLFGASGRVKAWEKHNSIGAKLAYFKKIIGDAYATMGEGNSQQAHMDAVAGLMDLAVEKTLNKPGMKPLVDKAEAELIHDLAELHDIGKTQMSSAFLRPWRHLATEEDKRDFVEHNHNHPLFTLLELLVYPAEAKMAAAHHHGVFRYSDEELKHALGEDFSQFTILKDNLKPEEISPLSYMLRLCDVTESMTGSGKQSLEQAVQEMAAKVQMQDGKPVIGANTIHPDYLCLMIKNGVFDNYDRPKDAEKLKAVEQSVLEKFGWAGAAGEQKEAVLRAAIAADPLLKDPANQTQELAR